MNKLLEAVTEDIRCHRKNGVSLNPYSTAGSRNSWQRGFDGLPERIIDYKTAYQRGQLASKLIRETA